VTCPRSGYSLIMHAIDLSTILGLSRHGALALRLALRLAR
jgi:hypothetical protein